MLQVSVPIAHELLAQYVNQGHALVQRASLVGDFSDYESWKAARKQWIEPTVEALEHVYDGSKRADDFKDAVTPTEGGQRWQEQYTVDLDCVRAAIDLLSVFQGELAFERPGDGASGHGLVSDAIAPRPAPDPADLTAARDAAELPAPRDTAELASDAAQPEHGAQAASPALAPAQTRPLAHSDPPAQDDGPAHGDPPARGDRPAQADSPSRAAEPLERLAEDTAALAEPSGGTELSPAPYVGSELAPQGTSAVSATPAASLGPLPAGTKQVVLAHGRNEKWKQAVANLLEQAGSHEIVILNERASERGTLVEQLGAHTPGARYAVVLLTADDVGAPRLESEAEPYFSPRARQGVVFEMGFLVAALTPGCVCVLYEDGVELPCDLEGIAYVRLDLAGTWQPKLLLHLRKAGFDYDLNRLVAV